MRVWRFILSVLIGIFSSSLISAESPKSKLETMPSAQAKATVILKENNLHPAADIESWNISGTLENEQAEQFAYYFTVQRIGEQFSYFSQIIKLQTKEIIFQKSEQATLVLSEQQGLNFKISHGFLRYNEINNSWTFGVDSEDGFNLRVESLTAANYNVIHLKNISFYMLQSKRVNGDLARKNKQEFVTSSNAWLAHQWQNKSEQEVGLLMERLLCRIENNQGVMLVKAYQDKDAIFSQADLLDPQGDSYPVSQFGSLSQIKLNEWQVKLLSPKKTFYVRTNTPLQWAEGTKISKFYLGVIEDPKKQVTQGVCFIIKDEKK